MEIKKGLREGINQTVSGVSGASFEARYGQPSPTPNFPPVLGGFLFSEVVDWEEKTHGENLRYTMEDWARLRLVCRQDAGAPSRWRGWREVREICAKTPFPNPSFLWGLKSRL